MAHYNDQILKPSKPWLNLSDLCKSKLFLTKPKPQTCSMASCDQNPGTRPPTAAARATTRGQWLLELSHAPPQILDSQPRSQSHAPPRRPCHPPIYLAWESGGHTTLHAPPGFLAAPPHIGEHCMLLHAPILLLMSSDVIWWRHHSMSAAMQTHPHQP